MLRVVLIGPPQEIEASFYTVSAKTERWYGQNEAAPPLGASCPIRENWPSSVLTAAMSPTDRIPRAMAEKFAAVTALTDAFCAKLLNEEYRVLIHRVVANLARKRPSDSYGGNTRPSAVGGSETFKRQRKRFQLELEISGGAIQLRRPLRPSQKLPGRRNHSWLVGDFAPKRAHPLF
jgi:hypothetical protein